MYLPLISIVIPTLNAAKHLKRCLRSIYVQQYPKDSYEVIIVDGGSSDSTIEIAKSYGARIHNNPGVDAESGKSIGILRARGKYVVLVDADNEISGDDWLDTLIRPVIENRDVFGVESPWMKRRESYFINRYFNGLGMCDPLAYILGLRIEMKEETTHYEVHEIQRHYREKISSLGSRSWSLGVNGFLWKKETLLKGQHTPKFEEANFIGYLLKNNDRSFATIKNVGIYHHYVESFSDFVRKRRKIGIKFLKRKEYTDESWVDYLGKPKFILGVLYCGSFVGPLLESICKLIISKELAWLFHPVACFFTVYIYIYMYLKIKLKKHFGSQRYQCG